MHIYFLLNAHLIGLTVYSAFAPMSNIRTLKDLEGGPNTQPLPNPWSYHEIMKFKTLISLNLLHYNKTAAI